MIRSLPDARWACTSCGACCQGFRFGPVEPAVIQGLIEKNIAADWEPAKGGWYSESPGPDGQPAFFLRSTPSGACVFLQPDRRCAIHHLHGAEAKPGFCREFPFRPVQIGLDTALIVRGECAGLASTFQSGPLLSEQAAEVLALPRAVPVASYAPRLTEILPGLGVDPAAWDKLEALILPRLGGLEPVAAVVALRGMLAQAMGRPLPQSPQAPQALQHLVGRLHHLARQGAQAEGLLDWQKAVFADAQALLDQALRALVEQDPPAPFSEDGRDYASLLLRQCLLGREFAAVGSVAAGLGRVLLESRIVQAVARGPLDALQFGRIHSRYLRFVDHGAVQQLLRSESGALVTVFLGV